MATVIDIPGSVGEYMLKGWVRLSAVAIPQGPVRTSHF